jgi:hypothetical protein
MGNGCVGSIHRVRDTVRKDFRVIGGDRPDGLLSGVGNPTRPSEVRISNAAPRDLGLWGDGLSYTEAEATLCG